MLIHNEPPCFLQILTPDYSIEGFTNPSRLKGFERAGGGNMYTYPTDPVGPELLQPRVTSTGRLPAPTNQASTVTLSIYQLAIIIPRDAPSEAFFTRRRTDEGAHSVVGLVGSYQINGQLSPDGTLQMGTLHLIRNAQITSRQPESAWPGLSVPVALINPLWLHAYLSEDQK